MAGWFERTDAHAASRLRFGCAAARVVGTAAGPVVSTRSGILCRGVGRCSVGRRRVHGTASGDPTTPSRHQRVLAPPRHRDTPAVRVDAHGRARHLGRERLRKKEKRKKKEKEEKGKQKRCQPMSGGPLRNACPVPYGRRAIRVGLLICRYAACGPR